MATSRKPAAPSITVEMVFARSTKNTQVFGATTDPAAITQLYVQVTDYVAAFGNAEPEGLYEVSFRKLA